MSAHDPLSKTLQSWQHQPEANPEFNLEVWARVHTAGNQRSASVAFYRWALPIAASLALAAGIGSAVREGQQEHRERMASAYAQSIDPLQMHPIHTR